MKLLPARGPASIGSVALAALLSPAVQAQPVIFEDGDFNPADWTATLIPDTTSVGGGHG